MEIIADIKRYTLLYITKKCLDFENGYHLV